MPLEFPSSPVDGQVYDNWVYSSSKGAWLAKPLEPTTAVTSDTPPANPIDGDMWFNTENGTTYVYYNDGSSAQWVEMVASPGFASPLAIAAGGTGSATVAGAQNNLGIGLVPIVAPTVNFSGGAATSNSLGEVSFSAVTSLSLNNVFTAGYNAYKIVIAGLYGSVLNAAYDFRFRGGGADRSATSYFQNGYQQLGANAPSLFQVSSFSSFQLGNLDTNAAGFGFFICEVLNPFESVVSLLSYDGHGYNANRQAVSSTGFYNVAQSQDGFTIYPRSGSATGTVKVWGYNI